MMNCFNQVDWDKTTQSVLTGEEISNWSEQYRYECELRHCLNLHIEKRREYLAKKREKHGDKIADKFKRDAEFIFKSRK